MTFPYWPEPENTSNGVSKTVEVNGVPTRVWTGSECQVCGCTEVDPCVDPATGETCAWFDDRETMCTFCVVKALAETERQLAAEAEAAKVQLYSESQANAFLRTMRAGGV